MKILFNTVDLKKGGGVSSYSGTLLSAIGSGVDNFTIGSRPGTAKEPNIMQFNRIVKDYFSYLQIIWMTKYDLVHINPSFKIKSLIRDSIFLLFAKIKKIKVLIFIHGWDPECERIIKLRFIFLFRAIYNKADAFVVLSNEFHDKLIEMGISKPIYVETTVVDNELFARPLPHRVGRETFNILYLSRVEKDKGIYESLDVFRILKKAHPQVTLTVAGDGDEFERAKLYASEFGLQDICFTGFIRGEEKHAAFCAADVYLFPTTYGEGMPTTVLEAMAYELPVVTRGVGGLNDFFENDKMGFISDSKDPTVFASYIEHLILSTEDRMRIGHDNRLYAKERFAADKVAERIRSIYEDTVYGTVK